MYDCYKEIATTSPVVVTASQSIMIASQRVASANDRLTTTYSLAMLGDFFEDSKKIAKLDEAFTTADDV